MYLLYDDKSNLPVSFFGMSAILHGIVFLALTSLALKMAELKPLKKEVIEFELATKVILQPVLTDSLLKVTKTLPAKVINKGSVSAALKAKPVVTKAHAIPEEQSEDFTPKEDFAKMDFKGNGWHDDAEADAAPEVKEPEDNAEAYSVLNRKYEAADLDSDLTVAAQNNAAITHSQEKKLSDELDKDAKALTAQTENYIESERKKSFIAPAKKQIKDIPKGSGASGFAQIGGGKESNTGGKGSYVSGSQEINNASHNKIGDSVTNTSTKKSSGVRALRELQQMSGNKKPEYSIADRRASKQGDVIYHAFISSKGTPERFVLIKSSGHESLDQNTLLALKKWKFFPGQEGWVELPFRWSLRGGAVEAPSLLRR